jgi:hypothetical protein
VAGSEHCDGIAVYMPERGDGIAALMMYSMKKALGKREKQKMSAVWVKVRKNNQRTNPIRK